MTYKYCYIGRAGERRTKILCITVCGTSSDISQQEELEKNVVAEIRNIYWKVQMLLEVYSTGK